MDGSIPEEEYERFFREARPRLLGQAYLLSGNGQEAQDLVREVLLRAWQSWGRVRDLDDPQAWARHVLHNLAVSQWRRRRLLLAHRVFELTEETDGPGVGHLVTCQLEALMFSVTAEQ
jgi:RNA polymerase sigma-70 factor (ECF subfamily)